jgi:hypothetical protein
MIIEKIETDDDKIHNEVKTVIEDVILCLSKPGIPIKAVAFISDDEKSAAMRIEIGGEVVTLHLNGNGKNITFSDHSKSQVTKISKTSATRSTDVSGTSYSFNKYDPIMVNYVRNVFIAYEDRKQKALNPIIWELLDK